MPDLYLTATGHLVHLREPQLLRYAHSPLWLPAAGFRGYAHYLVSASKLPWQVVAMAADVPLRTMRALLFGRVAVPGQPCRPLPRIRERDAAALLSISPPALRSLLLVDAPALPVAEQIQRLLATGMTRLELANLLGCTVGAVTELAEARRRCSMALAVHVVAICSEICASWVETPDEMAPDPATRAVASDARQPRPRLAA